MFVNFCDHAVIASGNGIGGIDNRSRVGIRNIEGIDVRKVVETGITPLINTGIAGRMPGTGQIGAGVVRAPLACFEQALEALAALR